MHAFGLGSAHRFSPCVGRVFVSLPNGLVAAGGGEPMQILGRFFTTSKRPPHFKTTSKRPFCDLFQNAHVAMRIAVACVTAMWCAKPSVGCEPPSGGAAGMAHLNSVLI